MKTIQDKIHIASKKVSIVLKLVWVMTSVIAFLAIVGGAILTLSNNEMQKSFLAAFDVTANNGTTISISPQNLLILFGSMFVNAMFMFLIIYTIYLIFRDISNEHTPFSKKNIVRIKRIAAITIVMSVIGSLFDTLLDAYTIGEMSWRIDVNGIILGLTIYCLALIFNYGCELQQISDETL